MTQQRRGGERRGGCIGRTEGVKKEISNKEWREERKEEEIVDSSGGGKRWRGRKTDNSCQVKKKDGERGEKERWGDVNEREG